MLIIRKKMMMTTLATPELSHAVAYTHYTIHMNVLSYTHMLSETLAHVVELPTANR